MTSLNIANNSSFTSSVINVLKNAKIGASDSFAGITGPTGYGQTGATGPLGTGATGPTGYGATGAIGPTGFVLVSGSGYTGPPGTGYTGPTGASFGSTGSAYASNLTLGAVSDPTSNYLTILNDKGRTDYALVETAGDYSSSSLAGDAVLRSVNNQLILQSGTGAYALLVDTSNNVRTRNIYSTGTGVFVNITTSNLECANTISCGGLYLPSGGINVVAGGITAPGGITVTGSPGIICNNINAFPSTASIIIGNSIGTTTIRNLDASNSLALINTVGGNITNIGYGGSALGPVNIGNTNGNITLGGNVNAGSNYFYTTGTGAFGPLVCTSIDTGGTTGSSFGAINCTSINNSGTMSSGASTFAGTVNAGSNYIRTTGTGLYGTITTSGTGFFNNISCTGTSDFYGNVNAKTNYIKTTGTGVFGQLSIGLNSITSSSTILTTDADFTVSRGTIAIGSGSVSGNANVNITSANGFWKSVINNTPGQFSADSLVGDTIVYSGANNMLLRSGTVGNSAIKITTSNNVSIANTLIAGTGVFGPVVCTSINTGGGSMTTGALTSTSITNSGTMSSGASTFSGTVNAGSNYIITTGTGSFGPINCGALTSTSITNSGTMSSGATTLSGTLNAGSNYIITTGTGSFGPLVCTSFNNSGTGTFSSLNVSGTGTLGNLFTTGINQDQYTKHWNSASIFPTGYADTGTYYLVATWTGSNLNYTTGISVKGQLGTVRGSDNLSPTNVDFMIIWDGTNAQLVGYWTGKGNPSSTIQFIFTTNSTTGYLYLQTITGFPTFDFIVTGARGNHMVLLNPSNTPLGSISGTLFAGTSTTNWSSTPGLVLDVLSSSANGWNNFNVNKITTGGTITSGGNFSAGSNYIQTTGTGSFGALNSAALTSTSITNSGTMSSGASTFSGTVNAGSNYITTTGTGAFGRISGRYNSNYSDALSLYNPFYSAVGGSAGDGVATISFQPTNPTNNCYLGTNIGRLNLWACTATGSPNIQMGSTGSSATQKDTRILGKSYTQNNTLDDASGNMTVAGTLTTGGIIQSSYEYKWNASQMYGANPIVSTPLLLLIATSGTTAATTVGNNLNIRGNIGNWTGQQALIDISIEIRGGLQYFGTVFVNNSVATQVTKADFCIYSNTGNTTYYYYLIINRSGIASQYYAYDFNVSGSGIGITLVNPSDTTTYTSTTISGQTALQTSILSQVNFVVTNGNQLSTGASTFSGNVSAGSNYIQTTGTGAFGPLISSSLVQDSYRQFWVTKTSGTTTTYYKIATLPAYNNNTQGSLNVKGSIVVGPGNRSIGECLFNFSIINSAGSLPYISGYANTNTQISGATTVQLATNGEFMYVANGGTGLGGSLFGSNFDIYYVFTDNASTTGSANSASFKVSTINNYWGTPSYVLYSAPPPSTGSGVYSNSYGTGSFSGTGATNILQNLSNGTAFNSGSTLFNNVFKVGGTGLYQSLGVSGTSDFYGNVDAKTNYIQTTGTGSFGPLSTGVHIFPTTTGTPALPTFTTRSSGTRVVIYPQVDASNVDHAIGVASSTLWYSVPNTSNSHKWYAGTSLIGTLSGGGDLTIPGTLNGSSTMNVTGDINGGGSLFIGASNGGGTRIVLTSLYNSYGGIYVNNTAGRWSTGASVGDYTIANPTGLLFQTGGISANNPALKINSSNNVEVLTNLKTASTNSVSSIPFSMSASLGGIYGGITVSTTGTVISTPPSPGSCTYMTTVTYNGAHDIVIWTFGATNIGTISMIVASGSFNNPFTGVGTTSLTATAISTDKSPVYVSTVRLNGPS